MQFPSEQNSSKSDLRLQMREVRRQLLPIHRAAASQLVVQKLQEKIAAIDAKRIALYLATDYEVNVDTLIDRCEVDTREIYLPHLLDSNVPFCQFTSWDQMEIGPHNLRQPSLQSLALPVEDFDIIVLPGLAFDRFGNRLGQGGGWYDRALSRLEAGGKKPLLVGVCFDEQLVDNVPCESFDVRMDMVVTPAKIYFV